MIDNLPYDIIIGKILSLLSTRDSVRTSILSSRWTQLYANVPIFRCIHQTQHPERTDPNFAQFVSNVLNTITNTLSYISEVYIHLESIQVDPTDVISWIETSTSHDVEKLSLYALWVESALTPHSLFTCETLESLSLSLKFLLSVPNIVSLPKLKILWLKHFVLRFESDDESVSRLLSNCPVLEELALESSSVPNARVLNISVPSLKVLSLSFWNSSLELSINCPDLEDLFCQCYYAVRGYTGGIFEFLKTCAIDVKLYEEQFEEGRLLTLVRQACKTHNLSFAGDAMEALLVAPGSLNTFENLTHLELESDDSKGWQLLPIMLNSSPRLKTLYLVKGFLDMHNNFGNLFVAPEYVPACVTSHLKVIQIGRFIGEEDEYQWVEYFLTSALVLETIEICIWSGEDSDYESGSSVEGEDEDEIEIEGKGVGEGQAAAEEKEEEEEEHLEIKKRLLALQPISEFCKIVIIS